MKGGAPYGRAAKRAQHQDSGGSRGKMADLDGLLDRRPAPFGDDERARCAAGLDARKSRRLQR
jgi:hypothetical protein